MADDPFALFDAWYAEARETELNDSNAMTVASVSADGQPSSRMVLLKGHDARGFVFYTNLQSRKARELIDRPKATPPLRGLGRLARERTVAGAFRIGRNWTQAVKGRRVVLIDDVYTTGATVKGCARVLKRAGAREVSVLCWARVVRDEEDMR